MAIKYIDAISIDGKGNSPERKLFNGYIYRLNYDISMGESKSSIVANIASEDGTYSINPQDLDYNRVYPIKIGNNISVNMFLEGYKKIVQPESKLIELKFVDTSVKMDKYFVGLYKRHGLKSKDNIIILGKEVHPCDKDFDGDIDDIPDLLDECHPCRNTASKVAELERVNCKEMNKYAIFPVLYNFSDLIRELKKFFKVANAKDPNPNYKQAYTGTVRDVLSEWCRDLGWTFYWEDETIKFLDLRSTIQISANLADFCPNLASYEEEYTLDGTVDRILASYYERPGSRDEHTCYDARHFRLEPYSPASSVGAELQVTNKIPEIAAGLIQYSEKLRDLWYFYDKYGMRDASKYKAGKELPRMGLTILSKAISLDGGTDSGGLEVGSLETTNLEPSQGLHKPKGFPSNPDPSSSLEFLDSAPPTEALARVQALILSNEKYKMCFELLNAEEQWIVANGLAKNSKDYFFYVGFYDEGLDRACKSEEAEYGGEFMGKYYVYQPNLNNEEDRKFFEDYNFKEDKICNIKIRTNDEKISYNPLNEGGGGTAVFYNNPAPSFRGSVETVSELPFAKWLRLLRDTNAAATAGDRERMFKLLVVQKGSQLFYPSPRQTQDSDFEIEGVSAIDNIKSERLIESAQKFASYRLTKTNNDQQEFVPRKVTELMNQAIDKNLDRTKVFIFIGRAVAETDFRVSRANSVNQSNPVGVPFDGKPIATTYEDEFDITGRVFYSYPDIKCLSIGNETNLCYKVNFKTPVGTFGYFEPTYSPYGIVVEKVKTIKKYPEKLQNFKLTKSKVNSKVGRIEMVEQDISDDQIAIFNNKNNSCRYNLERIKEFHDILSENFDFTYDQPLVSKNFSVQGVDITTTPKIGDGLIGIQISMDENGIVSSYTLGTILMKPISEGLFRANQLRSNKTKAEYTLISPNRNSSNQL